MSLESFKTNQPRTNIEHGDETDVSTPNLAEGLDKDPRVAGIRAELVSKWEAEYGNGKSILESGEGQDYIFGDPTAALRGEEAVFIDQRVEQEFALRFPNDALAYAEQEKTRIYENGNDPIFRKIDKEINKAATRRAEGAPNYIEALETYRRIESNSAWDEFISNYPKKAAAYRGKIQILIVRLKFESLRSLVRRNKLGILFVMHKILLNTKGSSVNIQKN